MTIENATIRVVDKPWGCTDLRPWSELVRDGATIGELWFERADMSAPEPALLFKLLFTREALSIQVHPDDVFARSIGLANGKTEAWYVLSATPDARIAVGLQHQLTASQLRTAIADGSISGQVCWRGAQRDDVVFVPAGTIHAIGAGLVIAEIQQRSDATFRLFDHGRQRELHMDHAVAASYAGPAGPQAAPTSISDVRTLLVANTHFVLERIDLPAQSSWDLHAAGETWAFVLEGYARVGPTNAFAGEGLFLDDERVVIDVGPDGLKLLLACPGPEPDLDLLHERDSDAAERAAPPDRAASRSPFHEPALVSADATEIRE